MKQLAQTCLFLLGALLLLPDLAAAQAGNSGLASLKIGVSGRGVSMGDAMSALASGAAATYYNPAGLLVAPDSDAATELMFMHKEWIQDTRTEFLGGAFPLATGWAWGISLITTTVSDIEIRSVPGPPDGTFTARDLSLGLSFAHEVAQGVRAGLTAKFLYEKILINEASGYAFDLGVQSETPLENLKVGAAVANLGSMSALVSEKIKLPALARFGPAYAIGVGSGDEVITVAADGEYVFPESRFYLDAGGECTFLGLAALRAGYQFGSAGRGLSAGVGFSHGIVAFDYAYARVGSDLGDTHTFSLALRF